MQRKDVVGYHLMSLITNNLAITAFKIPAVLSLPPAFSAERGTNIRAESNYSDLYASIALLELRLIVMEIVYRVRGHEP